MAFALFLSVLPPQAPLQLHHFAILPLGEDAVGLSETSLEKPQSSPQ